MVLKTRTWNGMKQTPLKRSPMKPGTKPLKQKPINKKSPRQIIIDKIWSGVRQQKILEQGGVCEICGEYHGFNLIAHHRLRRSYNQHTIENCAVVCRGCHDRIDADPTWAIKLGFKVQGY